MRLIVDANILIASLIKKGKTAEMLINPALSLFAPEFIQEEISKYKQEISAKTHRKDKQVEEVLEELLSIVRIISRNRIEKYISLVKDISPDQKDNPHLALAIMLNGPIWSNDKRLKQQDKVKIYSTEDLINALSKME